MLLVGLPPSSTESSEMVWEEIGSTKEKKKKAGTCEGVGFHFGHVGPERESRAGEPALELERTVGAFGGRPVIGFIMDLELLAFNSLEEAP